MPPRRFAPPIGGALASPKGSRDADREANPPPWAASIDRSMDAGGGRPGDGVAAAARHDRGRDRRRQRTFRWE
jgi:hypothetical protein